MENGDMTAEEARNARIIAEQHDHLSAGRIEQAIAQWSELPSNHGRPTPRQLLIAIFADLKTTFPDLSMPVEDLVASGPNVIVRCRFRGTHGGVGKLPVNGGLMIDVPATGRFMDVQHIHWYVLRDGLIEAHWATRDDIAMMQQLGLLPPTNFDFTTLRPPAPT